MVSSVDVSPATYVVDTHELGYPRRTAAYIVNDDRPTIVDTGLSTGAPHVFDALDELGIDPSDVEYVALTHIHMDHAGAVGALVDACENATVLVHEIGVDFISVPEKVDRLVESVHEAVGALADDYGTMDPVPSDRIRALSGGEEVDLGSRSFRVRHSPGHAPHQVAYFDADNGCLFPGDECGEYIDGTVLPSTPPPSLDVDALQESLDAFEALDPEAVYYPHYGERTDALAAINEYRHVLDDWVDTVAEHHRDDANAVAETILEDGHTYARTYDETVARELLRMNVEGVRHSLGSDT
jgi:glyoxylase-like metal-dependent hydrolase (beta-lactamase superfamily II)